MKKLIFGIAFLASTQLSADVFTQVFDGNPDLYDGYADAQDLPTAVQPGVGDAYGSVLLPGGYADSPTAERQGTHDGYGSILIDIGHNLDW